ncbi:MAG: acetylxylan esterase [Lentisphaeria bacterium]|nr:acetylxylan esterase [Lentisphaeria bacterium]
MAITFGNAVQEFYLEKVRHTQAVRKARLASLKTREDAEKFVAETRARVRTCFPFPAEKCPLNAKVTGTTDYPEFTMEKIMFHSRENYTVTANFFLPKKREGKVPAVLFVCGHAGEGKGSATYQTAMRGLAMRGFAVLAIDPVGQGERHQFLDVPGFSKSAPCTEHNILGKQMLLNGDWFGAWRTYDAVRGLDYLLTRPEIDPARVGVHGNSGGGTLTTWVSAVDDRFFAAAPSCFVTTWVHDIENELPSDIEQCPPNAMKYGLEISDFLIASAPRPYLLLGQKNDFFDPRGIAEVRDELKGLYKLLGCDDRIELCIGPTNHGLSVTLREAAYDFFCRRAGIANPAKEEGKIATPELAETYAAPDGEVFNMPDERRAHDLIVEKTAALKAARKPLGLAEMRRILIDKMGMDAPSVPYFRVLRPLYLQEKDLYVRRFGLETEPGRVMSILFSLVNGLNYIPEAEKAVLYIPNLDSMAEIKTRPDDGSNLYALDFRGIGECMPTTCNLPPGANFFGNYGFDFHYTVLGDMFGQSYFGGRVKDILCAVELLSQAIGSVELEGHGIGGIPALVAAVLSDKVKRIRLFDVPDSWEGMIAPVMPEPERSPMSYMIPGIMEYCDLPEMRAAIADKIIS